MARVAGRREVHGPATQLGQPKVMLPGQLQPGLPNWDAQEIVLNCVQQNVYRKEKGDSLQVCNLKMLLVLKLG